ncbi:MAG: transposase [Candidatus Omnitrophica bacterium]|nr:transposase [Candidatus Omnitrophota bacterium]
MPRTARVVVPGCFYHITQRGNNKRVIFYDDHDRRKYLYLIEEYRAKHEVEIFAYCLMNNHVHFIARAGQDGFAKWLNVVHMRYTQYFNKRYATSGHLWQGRYYSCVLDNNHFIAAVRYVERNPVRAQLVQKAWEWPWSSAREHIQKERGIIGLNETQEFLGVVNWKEYLGGEEILADLDAIRKATTSKRVWGSQEFIEELERKYGIKLSSPRMGRPFKCEK